MATISRPTPSSIPAIRSRSTIVCSKLRSNDMLNILVEGPLTPPPPKGLGCASVDQQPYRCLGVLHGRQILFRANVQLAPLRSFLSKH